MSLKVTKLSDFLNEALPLRMAKDLSRMIRKEDIDPILKQAFPTKERIYIDLDKEQVDKFNSVVVSKCESYNSVVSALENNNIEVIDFVNNLAKEPRQKNFTKITKILSKLGLNDELKEYSEDYLRKDLSKNKERTYKIVISKSNYDLAGMSTDRNWTSCMKLDVKDPGHIGVKGVGGQYSWKIPYEIYEGTIIAYLISSNDTNINNPFGRVLVKPFANNKKIRTVVWYPESVCYGNILNADDVFKKHFVNRVRDWVNDNLNSITTKDMPDEERFEKNPNVYDDGGFKEVELRDGQVTHPREIVTHYHNGIIKSITNYNEDGELDGEYRLYNIYGQLEAYGKYKNGKREGKFETWSNDSPYDVTFYKDDKAQSYKSWYPGTHQIKTEFYWEDGIRTTNTYYKNGKLWATRHHILDTDGEIILHGDLVKYDEEGNITEHDLYKNGKFIKDLLHA